MTTGSKRIATPGDLEISDLGKRLEEFAYALVDIGENEPYVCVDEDGDYSDPWVHYDLSPEDKERLEVSDDHEIEVLAQEGEDGFRVRAVQRNRGVVQGASKRYELSENPEDWGLNVKEALIDFSDNELEP